MKQKTAYGFFQDGEQLKIACLTMEDGLIRVVSMHTAMLEREEQATTDEISNLSLNLDLAQGQEIDFENEISFDTDPPGEQLSTVPPASEVINSLELQEAVIALNAQEDRVTNYTLPEVTDAELDKIVRTELLADDDMVESCNYTSFRQSDKNVITFIHHREFGLMNTINAINEAGRNQNLRYALIDPNEASLVNMYRKSYRFDPEEYVLILYLGREYRTAIVMKDNNYVKSLPIVVTDTTPDRVRQAVYSKIALAQDTGSIPFTRSILLAGDYSSDDDISFFQNQALGGEMFARFDLQYIDYGVELQELGEKLGQQASEFLIPIALAWKALQPLTAEFVDTNLLPQAIIEQQKKFRLPWYGLVLMLVMTGAAYMGTIKNLELYQQLGVAQDNLAKVQQELAITKPVQHKNLGQERNLVATLKSHYTQSYNIISSKNQWHNVLTKLAGFFGNKQLSWIDDINGDDKGFTISGYTQKRPTVERVASLFSQARINKVEQTVVQEQPLWQFEVTYPWPAPEPMWEPKIDRAALAAVQQQQVKPQPKDTLTAKPQEKPVVNKPGMAKAQDIANTPGLDTTQNYSQQALDEYNAIFKLFQNNKIEQALERLTNFKSVHAGSPIVYYAEYITGECHYALDQLPQAKSAFNKIIAQEGNKKADAYMMLGNTYLKMNDVPNALVYWKRLVKEFPQHELSSIAKDKIRELEAR